MLYILHSGNLYGTERMALATLAGMDEYDKRVVLAPPPNGNGSVAVAAREAGFETIGFVTRWDLVKALLPWFVRYRAIDVIGTGVAHNLTCYALSKLLAVRLRQLQVAHGGHDDRSAYSRKHHLNRLHVRTVAVSEYVRERLIHYGVRADGITVIDNFLSDAQRRARKQRPPYDPARSAARAVDPRHVKVAIVSRVDPMKRLDVLLDAVQSRGLTNFQFDVYGTGEDFDELRRRAASLPNVCFHGFVADVEDRIAGADFLLHLCPIEAFGLVVLEAFLARLVAIVPDAGGAGNLVEDGITGLRFRAGDAADLCEVLERARTMPAPVLQRIADAGNSRLETDFSQHEGVRRYRAALKADCGARP